MKPQSPPHARWHPRLLEAGLALHDNRLDVAERLLKAHLKDDPFEVAAMRMLAEVAARIGRMKDAETLLRRALEIAPNFTAARANLALVLGRTGRPAEALALLDALVEAEPDSVGHRNLKAATLGRVGEFDDAIGLYEEVLKRSPNAARVWLSYGHMLKTVGRQADGIDAYRRTIALAPTLGEAWFSLSNLKTVRFTDGDVAAMTAALETPGLGVEDRWHLEFALGKAMHDLRCPADAFAHYARGNALRRERHPFDSGRLEQRVDGCIASFDRASLSQPGGCDAPDPIFIVGMPRAGSTLVEQILASHPQVEGVAELPDMPMLVRGLKGYPEAARDMSAADRTAAGAQYLRQAGVQRRTQRPLFIDKLPNNWLFVPFILSILPNAKIIDARRHPMACCFSNFRQHFARGQDFAYDLVDLGRYYRGYVRLMAYVDSIAPGRVHRVFYERMVDDTEAEVRALLAACGLDFDPACIAFHETERAVRTASSEQVRQPIYRDSTDEWRPYTPMLEPLEQALGDVLTQYPAIPASFGQQ